VAGAAALFAVMVAVAGVRPRIFAALGDPTSPGAGVLLPAKELP
jgi:hypothetical protein